jgi:hypothetical protein
MDLNVFSSSVPKYVVQCDESTEDEHWDKDDDNQSGIAGVFLNWFKEFSVLFFISVINEDLIFHFFDWGSKVGFTVIDSGLQILSFLGHFLLFTVGGSVGF